MHIAEGVLSAPILISGGALAVGGCALGLKKLDESRLMPAALLSAAFFTGSLLHVPIGPATSAHLLLNGLTGVLMGWVAFPVIAVALLLQALLFQFGGITVLGVNTWNMAMPAVIVGIAARPWLKRAGCLRLTAAFLGGALGVLGAALLTALSLAFTDEGFATAAKLLFIAHLPIAVVEGLVTVSVVSFLAKVRPEMLAARPGS